MRLKGKCAIVVGAGSVGAGIGNGRATAMAFAREGARVLVVDNSGPAAEETCRLIAAEGNDCDIHVGDATSMVDCAGMVAHCLSRFGALDILHNNIGVMTLGGLTQISDADWDRTIGINLKSFFQACRHAVPVMVERGGGAIVNVGSLSAERYSGMPMLAYSTSKGAIRAFTTALAAEFGPQGIRVNQVTPGIIDTPTLATVAGEIASKTGREPGEAGRRAREKTVPLGRFGSAWDVAEASVYLASDAAAYVNGAEIIVDGGLSCMAP